ncbi:hypothetical protein HK57_00420 [Aspergillus ustus]|uniref:Short-chain dehydrogenase n=1 Tax=Aspergillus ustus TaxID=40382 RepID=A0A0C1BW88_ASPUT|nr:hypothetical protein HK57_00420 [Aspergillus ustus]
MADKDMVVKAMAFTEKVYRDVYPAIQPAQSSLSQAGKVIVITDATRGLGRGCAIAFAQAGPAAIVLPGEQSIDALAETEEEISAFAGDSATTEVLSIVAKVLDQSAIESAFERIVAQFGPPHVLVNNAGIALLGTIDESSIDDFWKVQVGFAESLRLSPDQAAGLISRQHVNVKGTIIVAKAFLKCIESAPEEQRTILNMTSVSLQHVPVMLDSYTISKTAIVKFTEFLAAQHPSITTISFDPGMRPTNTGDSLRLVKPFLFNTVELASGATVWLSSGDKKFLSGRYVLATWDVEELEARRQEIVEKNLLTSDLKRGDEPVGEMVIHP